MNSAGDLLIHAMKSRDVPPLPVHKCPPHRAGYGRHWRKTEPETPHAFVPSYEIVRRGFRHRGLELEVNKVICKIFIAHGTRSPHSDKELHKAREHLVARGYVQVKRSGCDETWEMDEGRDEEEMALLAKAIDTLLHGVKP